MAEGTKNVGRVTVKVSPDTKGFRKELERDLERQTRDPVEVKVDLDRTSLRETMAELKARLGAESPTVKIKAEVDRNTALNSLKALGPKMAKAAEQAGEQVSTGLQAGMGTAGGFGKQGLAGMAGIAALGALIASVLAPAIALASGALAAVPGLITSLLVPIGALTLGIDGLKKAAEQLKAPFDQLKQVMSKKTEDVFTPILGGLKNVFPTLTAQLPKVIDGLGAMAKSAIDTATSAQGLDRIRWTIGNIAAGLQAAAPGIGAFTSALLGLATGFSDKLPAIGQWFSQIGAQFDKWVTKVTSNGQLSAAFDNLGASIQVVVGLVGDLVAKGIEWLSDPKFGTALVSTFIDIKDAINATMAVLGPMFQVLSATLTTILAPLRLFTGEFEKLPLLLQVPIQLMEKLFTSISGMFSGINWSGMWDGLTTAASVAWEAVKTTGSDAWNTLVSGLTDAVGRIVTVVSELPGKVTSALAGMAKAGWDAGVQLVQGMINGVGSLVSSLVDKVSGLASSAINAAKSALGIHSPSKVFEQLGQYTGQGFVNGLDAMIDPASKTAQSLADAIQAPFENLGTYKNQGINSAFDFASANGNQLITDLGGSGNGALEAIMGYGMELGKGALTGDLFKGAQPQGDTFNFQVSNMDEALAAKQNALYKRALQYH